MRLIPHTLAVSAAALLMLSACNSADPLTGENNDAAVSGDQPREELVIGSQQYYSNTIVAELYAQVLEDQAYSIDRQFEIGQREVYLPELEAGAIDIFPEYTGNLLQYFDSDAQASTPDEVHSALGEALPEGLEVLDFAEATDQDSYVVTDEFAQEHDLTSVADLAELEDLRIASNSEWEARPYGPAGLEELYGVELTLVPVEDSGGPLTLNALLSGDVEVANIYSADPAIEKNDLVALEDPESLVLPQNLVPVVSANVDEQARAAINELQQLLTQEELLKLNAYSQDEQASPSDVAAWWLEEQGLLD